MKVLLMFPEKDFELPKNKLANEDNLVQDLELKTIFSAMSQNDAYIENICRKTLLSEPITIKTILYRQEIIKDCLKNPEVIRKIYDLPIQSTKIKQRNWMGIYSRHPSGILHESLQLLNLFLDYLKELREIIDHNYPNFSSDGFKRFFSMIQTELDDNYLKMVENIIKELRFNKGVLLSAKLGKGNEGTDYHLRKEFTTDGPWLKRIFDSKGQQYSFSIDPKDHSGSEALNKIRERVIDQVANAVAQSAEHIDSFFKQLQLELAFYIGCINLGENLSKLDEPITFPEPKPIGIFNTTFTGLYDISLSLTKKEKIVGNDCTMENKKLIVITGANQGGKSTFLRSIGVSQLLMQCGMFCPAENFSANVCSKIFTHFKREEDSNMKSGKLDEELERMSSIVDNLTPNSLLLYNESFASTNEREGSEIAKQIVDALLEQQTKIFFVTHLFVFAEHYFKDEDKATIFLRAERKSDSSRTYKLVIGEPLKTSYGKDLYYAIENEKKIHKKQDRKLEEKNVN